MADDTAYSADTAEEKDVDTDDEALLKASREGLSERISVESSQRALMLEDLKFSALDQWPADVRAAREGDVLNGPRPCLTVDNVNQYLTQVSNDMRKNRPSIKTRPVDSVADPETAKIFQDLIRHIEDQSSAQIAYQTAGESAVTMGLGFWRIVADYVNSDRGSEQELIIKRVPDTFSVYLGHHIMPDGSDAEKGWVLDIIPMETFKRDYPKAKTEPAHFDGVGGDMTWRTDETMTLCEYYYKKYTDITVLYLGDGRSMTEDEYEALPEPRPAETGRREAQKTTVMWCKHSGCEVLDRRELKGKYIPIVEVVGKEKIVEGKRLLWGLVRPAKDSLRAFNYWISALTEKMALSPKAPFVGAVGQFKSQGERWDKANVNNYAKLEYDAIDVNGNAVPPPRRQEPMQMEPAMVQMIQMMQNNVKSSLGMYKAALGETESQQSGRAILALQKESDTGTMHFGENQAISVTHCGRILVDLIPHYYDTKRMIRILGEDGEVRNASIDPAQEESMREVRGMDAKIRRIYNLGVGKYDVTISTGPGYTTSRQEAATVMTELANSAKDPISAAIMRYGAVKNSDFAGSEEIMRMLKAMLPPQLQQPDGEGAQIPPEAMQKMAQMHQQGQMMAAKLQEVGAENQQLKTGAQADMAKVNADHDAKMAALALDEKVELEKARLAKDKVDREIDLKERIARSQFVLEQDRCEHDKKMAGEKAQFDKQQSADAMLPDEVRAAHYKQELMQTDMMPPLMQALQGAFGQLEAALQQMVALQQQTLAAIQAPKRVSIGSVQKDAQGNITGASVASTPQAPSPRTPT